MFQAIVTRYCGPTNTKGSRIKATSAAGSIYTSCEDAVGMDVFVNLSRPCGGATTL